MSILFSFILSFTAFAAESVPSDSAEGNFKVRNLSLFTAADQHYFSTDRLSYRSYNRITGYDGTRPVVMLDGLPVDADFFGNLNPQYLPVASGQISRFDKQEGFGFAGTVAYQAGLYKIESFPLDQGWSVYGSTQISNETGEPGPWVYDPNRVTPNVERFGPGTDLSVNYRGDNLYVKTLYRYHRHLNTDLAIQNRMRTVVSVPGGEFEPSRGLNQLGMVETGSSSERAEFKARALYGESEEFLFFRPLGREIPLHKKRSGVALTGNFQMNSNWSLRTLFTAGQTEFGYRVNRFDYNPDLKHRNMQVQAAFQRESEVGVLMAGINRDQNRTDAPGLAGYEADEWALTGKIFREITDGLSLNTEARAAYDDDWFRSVSAAAEYSITNNWQISTKAAVIEMNPKQSHFYNHLVLQGYTLFENLDIQSEMPGEITKEKAYTIEVMQTLRLSESFQLMSEAAATSHRSFHIPFQGVEYEERMHTMPGLYQFIAGQTGNRIDLSSELNYTPGTRFQARLFAGYNRTLNGSEEYKTYWEMIPQWQVRYTTGFSPYPDLEIQFSAWYRSSSFWKEYDQIDGELFSSANPRYPPSFGTFSNRVPAHLQLNAKVAKWFWEQKLRTIVMVKNITNREVYSHPIGAREGLTFVLKAEFRF